MSEPALWIGMAVLFVLTSLLHFGKAIRKSDNRRSARIALGVSSLCWAASALLFRFYTPIAAYCFAGLGVICILAGGMISSRSKTGI
jgi:hypothetical protein